MDEGSPQAMLVAASTGLSTRIKARDGLTLHVDNLGLRIDPETTVRIVPDRVQCRRVEWRFFHPVTLGVGCAPQIRGASPVHVLSSPWQRLGEVRWGHS